MGAVVVRDISSCADRRGEKLKRWPVPQAEGGRGGRSTPGERFLQGLSRKSGAEHGDPHVPERASQKKKKGDLRQIANHRPEENRSRTTTRVLSLRTEGEGKSFCRWSHDQRGPTTETGTSSSLKKLIHLGEKERNASQRRVKEKL